MSTRGGTNVYRGMLRLYPRAHREEYGEAMVQLFDDRWRDERPTLSPLHMFVFWAGLVGDVITTALTERTEGSMVSFRQKWWLWLAVIGGALEVAALAAGIGDPDAAVGERIAGIAVGGVFAFATLHGVQLVRHGKEKRGGYLVAVGMIPVAAAGIVFFWFPPMYLATVAGIAVMAKALRTARRGASPLAA
jgi:hypothetical protein